MSDGIAAPVNVELVRQSATELEVTWRAPAARYRHLIAGYRVYYHITSSSSVAVSHGAERWEVKDVDGPLEVARLAGLKPRARYSVRVRARGVNGRLGNFSEPVVLEPDDPDPRQGKLGLYCSVLDSAELKA